MNVLLLSRYQRRGASSRLRFYQYLPQLAAAGIAVRVEPFFGDDYLARFYRGEGKSLRAVLAGYGRRLAALVRARAYDLIWLEGEVLPWLPDWVESVLAKAGIPLVVDYDDALFHRYDRHRSAWVRAWLGDKIDRIMRRAETVVAGSRYLAERATGAGARRVELIPTVVDLDRYAPAIAHDSDRLTIGWMGSRTTAPYLEAIAEVLSELAGRPNVRVALVGAGQDQVGNSRFIYGDWSEDTEVAAIRGFDIGIMPLPDSPWERGKCGYKLIQYMAAGKPVVASPVGANRELVEPGVNGFLASGPAEWRGALLELLANPERRTQMGAAGRRLVEQEYCLAVTAPRLIEILRRSAT